MYGSSTRKPTISRPAASSTCRHPRQAAPALLACAKADEDLRPKEPAALALAKIWWQAREHFGEAPADAVASLSACRSMMCCIAFRPASFWRSAASATVDGAGRGTQEEEIEFSWAGETARHVGTIVHRWLQRIADDELRTWDATRIDALASRFAKNSSGVALRA